MIARNNAAMLLALGLSLGLGGCVGQPDETDDEVTAGIDEEDAVSESAAAQCGYGVPVGCATPVPLPTPIGVPVAAPFPVARPIPAPFGVPVAAPIPTPIGVPVAAPFPVARPIPAPIVRGRRARSDRRSQTQADLLDDRLHLCRCGSGSGSAWLASEPDPTDPLHPNGACRASCKARVPAPRPH